MTADLVDTTALDAVMAFLLGEGSLDGYWFGDSPPAGRGPYWWRKQLREAAARLRAVATVTDEDVDRARLAARATRISKSEMRAALESFANKERE